MADIYEPDDASLLDTNDQLFTFSWLIERTATNFAGPLAFAIEFQCVVEGTVVYSWRTAANSTITVVEGINNANSTEPEVDEPPTDIYSTIRVATVASMIHDVIDSDVRFVIDPVTRSISNQDSQKLMLIRGDHKSERFTFEVPRFIEGHDMSLCNVVRIHYINTNSKTRAVMADVYEPTDMSAQPGNIVTFSWLIGRSATTFAGTLAFSIEFQCVVNDIIEYSWHTGVNNTIAISDGINNTEVLNEEYSDILTIWWERLYSSTELPIEIITQDMFDDLGFSARDNTLYILEDDPTLDEIEQAIDDVREFDSKLVKHLEQYGVLDKAMSEHLAKYLELNKNIAEHFDDFGVLLTEMNKLEKRISKLEGESGGGNDANDCDHVWVYIQQGPDLWDRYCSICGAEENDVEFLCVDGEPHTWKLLDVTNATCTAAAMTRYQCEKCGTIKYGETVQPALDHSYVDGVCTMCGKTDSSVDKCDHKMVFSTSVEPNCIKAGSITFVCSKCNTYTETTPVPALGHKYDENDLDHETPASCTTTGSKVYKCQTCDELVTVPTRILGHEFTESVTPPTCIAVGYTTRACTREGCGYTFIVPNSYVAPTGHKYENGVCVVCNQPDPDDDTCNHNMVFDTSKEATCTEDGYVRFKCSKCDYYNDTIVPAPGHTLGSPIYDVIGAYKPTCITPGYAAFVCSTCKSEVWDTIPSTGDHSWSDAIYDAVGYYEPTCTEPGYAGYVCSKCGGEKSEAVHVLGHKLTEVVTPPTCTEQGYSTRKCTRDDCDYSFVVPNSTVSALGHSWSDPYYSNEFSSGYGRKCSRCGELEELSYTDCEHPESAYHESVIVNPTCTEAGTKTCSCDVCNASWSVSIPTLAHSWGDPYYSNEFSSGYGQKCSRCGELEELDYVDCEHPESARHESVITKATCTETGSKTCSCDTCGSTWTVSIPALDHNFVESVVVDNTCTEPAIQKYACSRCGVEKPFEESDVIRPALDHQWVESVIIENTCTTPAYQVYRCNRCTDTKQERLSQYPPLGHSWSDAIYDVVGCYEPTCTEPGYAMFVCERCNEEKREAVHILGHKYTNVVTDPTCTERGYTTKTCTRDNCGYSYIDSSSYVDALGHDYEAVEDTSQSSGYIGVCKRCNDTLEDYTP
jgi:hypothetical protein